MFYCETCRVVNGWPKGMTKSWGPCEVCDLRHHCYDRPSSSLPKYHETKRISLAPLEGKHNDTFGMSDLLSQRHFRVIAIASRSPRRVVLDYATGDLADPATDPLIIGTIRTTPNDYSVRVLWNNKLWRPLDHDTNAVMEIMESIKPGSPAEFMKTLEQNLWTTSN